MKNIFVVLILIIISSFLTACGGQEPFQSSVLDDTNLVPLNSKSLGVSSVVPENWAHFFPTGTFVREMPQSDPTFLMFGVIPGLTPDNLMDSVVDQTGIQDVPTITGYRETEAFNWALYSFEIQQGFLLSYYPDYGVLMLDVALAESDGKVIAVATGTPVKERDKLYEQVFLPAVDALTFYNQAESADTAEIVLPERDYWPTEGWRTSTPEEQGMDGIKLSEMVKYINENNIPIKSVLIVRNGYIVLDEKFSGSHSMDNLKSVTKSFTSALVGIAIDKGYIDGVGQTVLELFPDREVANLDSQKQAMTVEDLLTMRAGLDWPSGPCWWLDGKDCADYTTQIMLEDEDSLQFILDQPMASEPGTSFVYTSGASHLLSALISETTGMSALDFAKENLFTPLGIHNVSWNEDGEGLNMGWTDIALYPHDMAKFGFLFLNEGQWNGKQIISVEWVRNSHEPHTITINKIQPNYGYQWWVNPDLGFYNASGAGGNYIIIIPEQDLVVVFTGSLTSEFGQGKWWEGTPEELFRVYILPAVE